MTGSQPDQPETELINTLENGMFRALEEMYPDETERRIARAVILLETRARVLAVLKVDKRKAKSVLSKANIEAFCKSIGEMLEKNRSLLGDEPAYQPLITQAPGLALRVRAELEKNLQADCRRVLEVQELAFRSAFLKQRPAEFAKKPFGDYGDGQDFAEAVLGERVKIEHMDKEILRRIADYLELPPDPMDEVMELSRSWKTANFLARKLALQKDEILLSIGKLEATYPALKTVRKEDQVRVPPGLEEKIYQLEVTAHPEKYIYLDQIAAEKELEPEEFASMVEERKLIQDREMAIISFKDEAGNVRAAIFSNGKILKKLRETVLAGKHWILTRTLQEELGIPENILGVYVEAKRGLYPTKIGCRKDADSAKIGDVMSPSVAREISDEILAARPPKDWIPTENLFERGKMLTSPLDERLLAFFNVEPGDMKHWYIGDNLRKTDYFSPGAATKIRDGAEQIRKNWRQLPEVAAALQVEKPLLFHFLHKEKESFSTITLLHFKDIGHGLVNPAIINEIPEKLAPYKNLKSVEALAAELGIEIATCRELAANVIREEKGLGTHQNVAYVATTITLLYPETERRIREEAEKLQGDTRASQFMEEHHISKPLMEAMVRYYGRTNPAGLRYAASKSDGLDQVFIRPALRELILEKIRIPSGWHNAAKAARVLGIDTKKFNREIGTFLMSHPGEHGDYWSEETLNLEPFFGEKLLAAFQEVMEAEKQQISGWPTLQDFAQKYERSEQVILEILQEIDPTGKQHAAIADANGEVTRIDPVLEETIKEKIPPPNNDWATEEELAVDIEVSVPMVKRIAKTRPDLQQEFYNRRKKNREIYLSPELVAIITTEYRR